MKLSGCAALAATLSVIVSTTNVAEAAFVLYLDDQSTIGIDQIITDDALAGVSTSVGNTTSADAYSGLGTLTYQGSAGNFNVNVTTGISKPELPGGVMDLNSITVSSTSGGTLLIALTDTDFATGYPGYQANYGGTTSGTVSFDFRFDNANAEFGGSSLFSTGDISSSSYSDSVLSAIPDVSPYSLSIFATITHGSGSQNTSFNAELRPVPLPAAIWLFGSGIIGLAGLARRIR
jgi:hypothetical protein